MLDNAKTPAAAVRAQRRAAVHGDGRRWRRRRGSKRRAAGSSTWRSASRPTARPRPRSRRRAPRWDRVRSAIPRRSASLRCARGSPGRYAEKHGLDVDPARIVVTTGSSAGFMLAFLAAVRAGRPGRGRGAGLSAVSPHPHRARLRAGADRDHGADTRWSITSEALVAAHRTRPLRACWSPVPANPTGTMMPAEALADLIRTAEDAGIAFISDEIYHGLDYAFAAQSAACISPDAIIINSFSKYFCMTGWRIGWMVVPPHLVRPIERLQQNLAISVPTLSQIAARGRVRRTRRARSDQARLRGEPAHPARRPAARGARQISAGRRRVLSLCRCFALLRRQLRLRHAHAGGGRRRRDPRRRFRSAARQEFPALLLRRLARRDARGGASGSACG